MKCNFTKPIYKALQLVLDELINLMPTNPSQGVCLIRLDGIGDFIIWLDAAKEFRGIYPSQHIVLIANSLWADLAKCLPYWDDVWSVDIHKLEYNICYRLELMRNIRRRGFGIAIHPTYSRMFLTGDALIRSTGARQRIGSVGDYSNILPWQKKLSDHWYTKLLPTGSSPMMELERNAEFIRYLGIPCFHAAIPKLPTLLVLPSSLKIDGVPYFIVFPGGSWDGRKWSIENYIKLVDEIYMLTGWQPVVCGSVDDFNVCAYIKEQCKPQVINLAGKSSLPEFVEIVRLSKFLIGNETSAVHIAASVNTPAICILGGGHFGRFFPYPNNLCGYRLIAIYERMECYSCNWRCNQPHISGGTVPCISSISVETVMDVIINII